MQFSISENNIICYPCACAAFIWGRSSQCSALLCNSLCHGRHAVKRADDHFECETCFSRLKLSFQMPMLLGCIAADRRRLLLSVVDQGSWRFLQHAQPYKGIHNLDRYHHFQSSIFEASINLLFLLKSMRLGCGKNAHLLRQSHSAQTSGHLLDETTSMIQRMKARSFVLVFFLPRYGCGAHPRQC